MGIYIISVHYIIKYILNHNTVNLEFSILIEVNLL